MLIYKKRRFCLPEYCTIMSDLKSKPHYIKKHVYKICKNSKTARYSLFFNERQARADVMCALFCGKIVSYGFKGATPVCTAYKEFNYEVGTLEGRACHAVVVIFADTEDLSEADIVTAYPTYCKYYFSLYT